MKETASLPHVRETISQYLFLVRELTEQSNSQSMNEELIKHITANQDSLSSFFSLLQQDANVKASLTNLLVDQLVEAARLEGLHRDEPSKTLSRQQYSAIYFTSDILTNSNLKIGFEFEYNDYRSLDFGFRNTSVEKKSPSKCLEELYKLFSEQFPTFPPAQRSALWPAYANFESPYENWQEEAFLEIISGQILSNMREKLKIMSIITTQVFAN